MYLLFHIAYCNFWSSIQNGHYRIYFKTRTISRIIGFMICIVGISGNLISHKILHKVGRKSVSIFLLKCLSVADSLYLLGYVFNWSIYSYLLATRDNRLIFSSYEYFHLYVGFPLYTTFLTVSSWMTCFLTIERYLLLPSANEVAGR